MSQQILQVNLKFTIPRNDLETAWLDAAQPIAAQKSSTSWRTTAR